MGKLRTDVDEKLDWGICKYASIGCEEAKDPRYFGRYCINNGQDCSMESFELLNKLKIDPDLY